MRLVAPLVVIGVVALGQHYGWLQQAGQSAESAQPGLYKIDHYIDGDTIAIRMNGKVEDVRFVGVDTPETHKPNTPVQCYGPEAAAYTKSLVQNAGGQVRLAADPESTNRDRYNRLLRYIYLPDGTLVERKLIQTGHGFYYPYFPFTKSGEFHQDEQQAMQAKRGLWGKCHPTPTDDGGYKMNEPEPSNL
jgi:micrococcal nuclease